MSKPTIVIVEDHPTMQTGIEVAVGDDFEVVARAGGVAEAIELIIATRPDVVLLDLTLTDGRGIDVLTSVRSRGIETKFLAHTVSTSRSDVVRLFEAGVDGYVTKATHDLVDNLHATLEGQRPISRDVAVYMLDIDDDAADVDGFAGLTPREREVVVHIARGDTYRECARTLGISVKTLESHMANIFSKTGVASRNELARLAYERNLDR